MGKLFAGPAGGCATGLAGGWTARLAGAWATGLAGAWAAVAPSTVRVSLTPGGNASRAPRGPSWLKLNCAGAGFGCSAVPAFCPENRNPNEGESCFSTIPALSHDVGNLPTTNSATTAAMATATVKRISRPRAERVRGTGHGSGINVGSSEGGNR